MYLSISALFTFKDRPKDYRGLTSERWKFGADGPRAFSRMAGSLVKVTLEYYLRLDDAATLNAELDELREWLARLRVDEEVVEAEFRAE